MAEPWTHFKVLVEASMPSISDAEFVRFVQSTFSKA